MRKTPLKSYFSDSYLANLDSILREKIFLETPEERDSTPRPTSGLIVFSQKVINFCEKTGEKIFRFADSKTRRRRLGVLLTAKQEDPESAFRLW